MLLSCTVLQSAEQAASGPLEHSEEELDGLLAEKRKQIWKVHIAGTHHIVLHLHLAVEFAGSLATPSFDLYRCKQKHNRWCHRPQS